MGERPPDVLGDALRRAQAGDDDGFLVLYRSLQPLLLRYLRVRTMDGADDLAAETWLQVVRDLDGFAGDAADFRGWLFTVARNRAIDAARARASRPVVPVADVGIAGDGAAPHMVAASAETEALQALSTRQALALVASLPPEQAELVALRVVAGLDVATVAAIVGRSPGAVRVSVHRALRALRAMHPDPRTEVR